MMEQTITVMSSLILKKNSLKQCFVVYDGKKKFKGENVLVSIKLPSNKTREQN